MPRTPRLNVPDGVYHVTNRGVDRQAIVRDDRDRWKWFDQFSDAATACRWRVFAYALLDNHFHLFVRTPEPNLSDGMHDFESSFASSINRRHKRTGPLFQGRFHAVLVESESHLWQVSRYTHLNPYRAGLTRQPAQYAWCSYRYFLNPRGAPDWLDWRTVLAELGRTEAAARVAYKRFVEAGMNSPPPNPFLAVRGGVILGSDKFIARMAGDETVGNPPARQRLAAALPRPNVVAVIDAVTNVFGVSGDELRSRGRHGNIAREVCLLLCRELTSDGVESIGKHFGVTASTVTDSVRRVRERMEKSRQLCGQVDEVRSRLLADGKQ
ncbi:MAG TPA: helix-turn-helix domain-containing protein [Pirellulaceae bacterium]|nr:helix-turn-helix domain-containing protein [Pirellulaceae bacterium]